MLRSIGPSPSLTGSSPRRTPSRPAQSRAAKVRYGLAAGSGGRNSIRLAFGLLEYMGIRTAALRFRAENTRFTGASKPGTRRRSELVVGAAKARIAGAWIIRPAI